MQLPSADLEDVESAIAGICDRLITTLLGNTASTSLGPSDRFYGANDCQTTLHSTVVAKVNGVQARIMLDSGASSSYISATY